MITFTPALQIAITDPLILPQAASAGNQPIACPISSGLQEAVLAPGASSVALPFPIGLTTAKVIYIASLGTSDLVVNIGGTPFAMSVPACQGVFLYGLTSAQVSLSSALGGEVQFTIGG